MKENQYAEEQIAHALKQAELGTAARRFASSYGLLSSPSTAGEASIVGC